MSDALIINMGDGGGNFRDKKPLPAMVPFEAKVHDIQVKQRKKYQSDEMEDVLMITFEVTEDGEHQGDWASGFVRPTLHEKATFNRWMKAFYENIEPGVQVNARDVIGKPCQILTEPSKDGKFSNVKQVIQAKGVSLLRAASSGEVPMTSDIPAEATEEVATVGGVPF